MRKILPFRPATTRNSAGRSAKIWRWSMSGLLLGCTVATVVFAPARWAAWAVDSATQGRLQLHQPTGTVWAGQARLQLTGGEGSNSSAMLPGTLQWTTQLRWSGLDLALQAPCCTHNPLRLQFTPRITGWTLVVPAHQSDWPAQLLSGLGTPWNTVQAQGTLALDTPGFTLEVTPMHWTLEGTLRMDANDIASRLSTLRPLGSYRIDLRGGTTPALTLATRQGALQVQGQGQWAAGRWHFQGDAQAEPGHEAALTNLLNIVGQRQGARSLITLG
jgi:general secretion pathway protein N